MERNSKERLRAVLTNFESIGRENDKPSVSLSPDEIRFRSLIYRTEKTTISFRQAVRIVGGRERLIKLLVDGVIRGEKPDGASNNKFLINAADCYRNVKPHLDKICLN